LGFNLKFAIALNSDPPVPAFKVVFLSKKEPLRGYSAYLPP
jgi:hypothetical protein